MYSPNPREHISSRQKDEITFTKCSVPGQNDNLLALLLHHPEVPQFLSSSGPVPAFNVYPLSICIEKGQVYLAGDTTNQFSANLMHKGYAQISRQSLPLSLMCFIIEFNAKIHVP